MSHLVCASAGAPKDSAAGFLGYYDIASGGFVERRAERTTVRGVGLLLAIELAEPGIAEEAMYRCLTRGVSFKVGQGNVIVLAPPLVIGERELADGLALLDRLLAAYDGPDDLFAGELHHRGEHSIEFQALYLRHRFGARPVAIEVPWDVFSAKAEVIAEKAVPVEVYSRVLVSVQGKR